MKHYIDHERVIMLDEFDTNVITSVVKQYLQGLPDPILTKVLYPRFITVSNITDPKIQLTYLCSLINSLPPVHLDLLRFLVGFLSKVIAHEETNKMCIQNISIVFGPILMQANIEDPKLMLAHANLVTSITKLILSNSATIFAVCKFFYWIWSDLLMCLIQSNAHSIHTVKALNPYIPKKGLEGALEVQEGSVIHVFKKDNTIWHGEIDGKVGFFPRSEITRSSKVIIIKDVCRK